MTDRLHMRRIQSQRRRRGHIALSHSLRTPMRSLLHTYRQHRSHKMSLQRLRRSQPRSQRTVLLHCCRHRTGQGHSLCIKPQQRPRNSLRYRWQTYRPHSLHTLPVLPKKLFHPDSRSRLTGQFDRRIYQQHIRCIPLPQRVNICRLHKKSTERRSHYRPRMCLLRSLRIQLLHHLGLRVCRHHTALQRSFDIPFRPRQHTARGRMQHMRY